MKVHVVLVAALAAAILTADGDLNALAADRRLLRRCVEATRDGFDALVDQGVRIAPRSIEVLYRRMPRWFAVEYWRRALPGPVGAISMAPHARSSAGDELPVLWAEATSLTGGGRSGAFGRFLQPVTDL
ncbi:hypothetical protein LKO27_11280 [Tessaracoccus sp. OS52]|uniref:hypothetical protein n=1 Tax=Tessaracoccus sp. OS52 TaxID=2886691 RepID=UPI001D0FA4F2|nr:hypothetical protein [Tessaracoccus sp. OS52]MCC2593988.1 hypothetical protein [Tessaracoccus sp. OS52]